MKRVYVRKILGAPKFFQASMSHLAPAFEQT